jgi:uncharacterized membrane protein
LEKEQYRQLLDTKNEQLKKLNDLVMAAIQDEKLISEKLYDFEDANPGLSGRLADAVATFGGSWRFIIAFLILMCGWIGVNIYLLSSPFDPYPFILLNLLLSTVAALQAPIIMMSQNRKEEKDRQRAINDYLVNLKAEIEVRNLHEKINLLMQEQMQTLFEIQQTQLDLMEETRDMIRDNFKEKNK